MPLNLDKRHIVIEGPIGVGKSSLCRKLSEISGGYLFLEKPTENPFLERFYKDQSQFALATQLHFLLQRVQQSTELRLRQADGDVAQVIADFMIEKDPIFAKLTLSNDELALYQQIFDGLTIEKTYPDLIVYLQAPVNVLKQRVKKRNIKSELKIEKAYLENLSDAYTQFFHDYQDSPLLIVNAAEFNLSLIHI